MSEFGDFRGSARRIDDLDIPRIGHRIGVGEDELHAFMDVEAAGSGFDRQGRPKMLFEPHVFFRNLTGEERTRAVSKGLAYSKWRAGSYPTDSYPRLKEAMEINETAALRSASWGLGQILGENHKMVGYDTPQEMVRAFMDDEAAHLDAIVSFLIAAGIADDLKAHRWEVVARVYNGPRHAEHDYAGRMRRAFAKWRKIPDTPWSPDMPVPTPRPEPEPAPMPNLTPVEQMNKPVSGAVVGSGVTMPIGAAAAILMSSAGWLPDAWMEGTPAIAFGIFTGWAFTQVGNFIGSYRAADKRFQA